MQHWRKAKASAQIERHASHMVVSRGPGVTTLEETFFVLRGGGVIIKLFSNCLGKERHYINRVVWNNTYVSSKLLGSWKKKVNLTFSPRKKRERGFTLETSSCREVVHASRNTRNQKGALTGIFWGTVDLRETLYVGEMFRDLLGI